MHKYTIGTPIFKNSPNKIKGYRGLFQKVRKTGNYLSKFIVLVKSWGFIEESCIKDEGGPLGIGLQELVSNHLMLHCLRDFVVSDKEKGLVKRIR